MGLLKSTDIISIEPTVSLMEARILCSALNHDYYEEVEGEDKYFTPDEYRRLSTSQVCSQFAQRLSLQDDAPISSSGQGALLEQHRYYSRACNCVAHAAFRESDDAYGCCLGRLISIPSEPLTDHYGYEVAESLLPFLFKKVEHEMFSSVENVSMYDVNFVLWMPSGRMYHFTGRPDLSIHSPYCGAIAWFVLKGIGEVQSPPGRRSEYKTAAFSRAGVSTAGQLGVSSLLPAIVIHKDKTVQIAMVSLNVSEKTIENSLQTVSFKLVGQAELVDLKNEEGLMLLSGQWKGVMDAMYSH